jgi:hypothetical protein
MKRKVNKKNYTEVDNFDRKKKNAAKKDKNSKRRISIYDEFEEEDLDDYSFSYDDFDEDDDY